MRISSRYDYACRALLELSLHWPNIEPLQIRQISIAQNIPLRFLVQILIQLKRAGLVSSVRGKAGGYRLTKKPSELSLADVLKITGSTLLPETDLQKKNESIFDTIWDEVDGALQKLLSKITFDGICSSVKKGSSIPAYDI